MTTPDAPDPRKVAETALDVFVYAPMGLALEAKELLPKLAERGRNQVVLARLGARFAMQRAEAEVEKLLERLQPHDEPTPAPSAGAAEPPTATAGATADAPAPTHAPIPTAAPAPVATPRAAAPPRVAKSRAATSAATRKTPAAQPVARAAQPKPSVAQPKVKAARSRSAAEPPKAAAALAIPGYDTLSASQVVPRLDALRPNELEAIRRHEVAHRGRRTILSRIAQLQG